MQQKNHSTSGSRSDENFFKIRNTILITVAAVLGALAVLKLQLDKTGCLFIQVGSKQVCSRAFSLRNGKLLVNGTPQLASAQLDLRSTSRAVSLNRSQIHAINPQRCQMTVEDGENPRSPVRMIAPARSTCWGIRLDRSWYRDFARLPVTISILVEGSATPLRNLVPVFLNRQGKYLATHFQKSGDALKYGIPLHLAHTEFDGYTKMDFSFIAPQNDQAIAFLSFFSQSDTDIRIMAIDTFSKPSLLIEGMPVAVLSEDSYDQELNRYQPLGEIPDLAKHFWGERLRPPEIYSHSDITTKLNVEYSRHEGTTLLADITYPNSKALPDGNIAIVSLHGGNHRREPDSTPSAEQWAQLGFVVMTIDYQHGPSRAKFEARDDLAEALEFIVFHADRYGVNPANIFVLGQDAGAYVAAWAALQGLGTNRATPAITGVIAIDGAKHFLNEGRDLEGRLFAKEPTMNGPSAKIPILWIEAGPDSKETIERSSRKNLFAGQSSQLITIDSLSKLTPNHVVVRDETFKFILKHSSAKLPWMQLAQAPSQ